MCRVWAGSGVVGVFALLMDFDLCRVPFPILWSVWSCNVRRAKCSLCAEQLGIALPVLIVAVLFIKLIRSPSPHLNILLFNVSV